MHWPRLNRLLKTDQLLRFKALAKQMARSSCISIVIIVVQ
jgi:hypothetical protein